MGRLERGWPEPPEPLPLPVVDNHTHLEAVLELAAPGADRSPPSGGEAPDPGPPAVRASPVGVPTFPPRTLADHLSLAAAVGVTRMVQIGCDLESAAWTSDATAAREALLGGVAIHPNEAVLHAGVREVAPDRLKPDPRPRHSVSLDDAIARIADLARGNERIRAIGETGLDYFRAGDRGRAVQREAFRAHIALAKELGLALQIHDRDAHAAVMDLLERDGAPERTVFHCFSGDAEMARRCAAHGWYLSFAGPVTFRANDELRTAARATPLDLLLVETDAPYLTPHPHRGRPNAPYQIPHTVRTLAAVLERPEAELCERITRNSTAVYGTWGTA